MKLPLVYGFFQIYTPFPINLVENSAAIAPLRLVKETNITEFVISFTFSLSEM